MRVAEYGFGRPTTAKPRAVRIADADVAKLVRISASTGKPMTFSQTMRFVIKAMPEPGTKEFDRLVRNTAA